MMAAWTSALADVCQPGTRVTIAFHALAHWPKCLVTHTVATLARLMPQGITLEPTAPSVYMLGFWVDSPAYAVAVM